MYLFLYSAPFEPTLRGQRMPPRTNLTFVNIEVVLGGHKLFLTPSYINLYFPILDRIIFNQSNG